MNEQIKLIFKKVIPVIQANNVKYWIYGGIANAAMVGDYYRNNPDVDIFVLEDNFKKTEEILEKLCLENGWKISITFLKNRPKVEIVISGKECLSIVPIYIKCDNVELIFEKQNIEYPLDFLQQIERTLEGYFFYTISDEYLKRLFIVYLDSRREGNGKMLFTNRSIAEKRLKDARVILSDDEFDKYF